ncbi:hypothetical protein Tco_1406931 [Tanacetum coccineum]
MTESLENVVLAKSSSQPQSTYMAATSLVEFELKKILLDKLEQSKSYQAAKEHRELYDALVKSYQLDKDLFDSYGKAYSLKRGHKDKDKDEDPPAGSDQGLKKRKTSKDVEPSKGSKSKDSKTSSSKGSKSQPKSFGKSVQSEEPVFETADTKIPQDQGGDMGNIEDQPSVEESSKHDCEIAKATKPPLIFDELMNTPIDFLAYVIDHLKIDNLTQQIVVGPAFNLLKGTCKSQVELEYHLEECYKAANDRLDWTNPEGKEYPFDLSKPLPLIEVQGRIEDMVPTLWSPVKVAYDRYALWEVSHWVMKWYDYGYLEEIEVRREDESLYKFKEGDFPNLNLRNIEDMLLLLVQEKISNLSRDVIFDLNVALQMFTRRVVIQKRMEDLQLGVESYQKKLNITRPETFRSDIPNKTPYTVYNNPQGIIYIDKLYRNILMCSDELYKFSDGTLKSV